MLDNKKKQAILTEAAALKGSAKRAFMAQVVRALGRGGQRTAESQLGWSRHTIRKGERELRGDVEARDNFSARGRKPSEQRLPNLMRDIETIVGGNGKTTLTGEEVRRRLLARGYDKDSLPTSRTINSKIKSLGYR